MNIDEATARAIAELYRQRHIDDWDSPYVAEGSRPDTLLIDGQVDIRSLVEAILVGESPP